MEICSGNTQLTPVHVPDWLVRASGERGREKDLNSLGRGKLCFLSKSIQFGIPQILGGVGERGGMLPGLTHLFALVSFSWNAWPPAISPTFSERARIHFLRGASVITLFPSRNQAEPYGAFPEKDPLPHILGLPFVYR